MNSNVPISTIMTEEVVCVNPSQKLVDIKHIFEKKKFHHHIPVIENGKLKGMISLIDFMYAIKNASLDDNEQEYQSIFVKDIMSVPAVSKPSSSSIKEVAEELAKGRFHAIVIADEGRVKGIVSTADVIRYFLNTINFA